MNQPSGNQETKGEKIFSRVVEEGQCLPPSSGSGVRSGGGLGHAVQRCASAEPQSDPARAEAPRRGRKWQWSLTCKPLALRPALQRPADDDAQRPLAAAERAPLLPPRQRLERLLLRGPPGRQVQLALRPSVFGLRVCAQLLRQAQLRKVFALGAKNVRLLLTSISRIENSEKSRCGDIRSPSAPSSGGTSGYSTARSSEKWRSAAVRSKAPSGRPSSASKIGDSSSARVCIASTYASQRERSASPCPPARTAAQAQASQPGKSPVRTFAQGLLTGRPTIPRIKSPISRL